MKKIKFSIITPCLNRVHYLRETIESVLNQTVFKNNLCEMQYIIIDGGSDDGSLELIKEYNKIHQNIEYISEKDEGMYDALTKGFEKCTGDIISYINAGDFYNLNAFEIIENILNNSHNIDWVTGGKYIYNEKSLGMFHKSTKRLFQLEAKSIREIHGFLKRKTPITLKN